MTFYQPDATFRKDLRTLDPKLGCHYEKDHEHFVITYKRPTGDPVPLMMVKRDDGGFRQPDQRDIEKLKASDRERESPKEKMARVSKHMSDVREMDAKRNRADIRDRTKDSKIQLQNVVNRASGSGKPGSQFRKIDQKPKGKVFN